MFLGSGNVSHNFTLPGQLVLLSREMGSLPALWSPCLAHSRQAVSGMAAVSGIRSCIVLGGGSVSGGVTGYGVRGGH